MEIEEFNFPTWRLRSSHVQSSGLEEPPCLETLGSGWEKKLLPKAMDHPVHPVRRQTEMLPQLWIWASGKFPAKSKEMISVPNELLKEENLLENCQKIFAHLVHISSVSFIPIFSCCLIVWENCHSVLKMTFFFSWLQSKLFFFALEILLNSCKC